MNLVIVESPTKAKTISKFLGKGFAVESSYGHIRDLPKSKLGIDVERDFAPHYVIPQKSKEIVANLKKLAGKAETVILATDEDREGEAIAWHLSEALELGDKRLMTDDKRRGSRKPSVIGHQSHIQRIAFHEITEQAIKEALKNPRPLDVNLINAQQARRVLDRLVGYGLSPFLWRKVRYGLSAGRVQSVTLRLIVEREKEIQAFKKEAYWSVEASFLAPKDKRPFSARLYSIAGKTIGKMDIKSDDEARKILNNLQGAAYLVSDVATKEVRRAPAPPFTTSTLQQEAARKLGFSAKQTMLVAQRLYENGQITYMRTDSAHLAESALAAARGVIAEKFGEQYALPEPRRYATKSKGAQEAHEAIRPTNLGAASGKELGITDRSSQRLYDLIWKRTVASQMQEALLEQTSANIETGTSQKEIFRASGQTVKFDGFIRVYTEGKDEEKNGGVEGRLPKLETGARVKLLELKPLEHWTEPPPRYTDATLVKALEADGVGRPSTYAPTLSTIQTRGYVEKLEKKYHPTEIGVLVNDLLVENFPEIVDIKFTARIEEEFDEVAEGKIKWTDVCKEFYGPFKKNLDEKEASVEKQVEVSGTPCPHCGKPMLVKFGRMGKFLACPEPGVKVTLPMPEEAAKIKELEEKTGGERCPLCGKPMAVKRGRFGYFLGCSDYPRCKGVVKIWNKTGFKCPNCREKLTTNDQRQMTGDEATDNAGHKSSVVSHKSNLIGDIVEKKSRGRGKPFYACTRYPECAFVMNKKPESEEELLAALKNWKENPPKGRTRKKSKDAVNKQG